MAEEVVKDTPALLEAKKMIPLSLHAELLKAVAEYRFASLKIHGTPFASPRVIAELILMGWRTEGSPKGPDLR